VSDIYGAMTGNFVKPAWGHKDSYWWFDFSGGRAASEFWAGYAADTMIDGSGKGITEQYFPQATALANQMAQEMAE